MERVSQNPSSADSFKSWLLEHGGGFHQHVAIAEINANGASVVATEDLSPDTTIVSCPFSLVITKSLAQTALSNLLDIQTIISTGNWSDRQWISTYLCFHWIIDRERPESVHLSHYEYIQILPQPDKLRTPLYFTPSELEAFRGTNIYGATLDRQREWREEYRQCLDVVSKANPEWSALFTWELYLTGATYLSSRAFPSTLLSPNPTLVTDPSTEPILIPGLDSLNHARGAAVTWAVDYPNSSSSIAGPIISLVFHNSAKPTQEILNNYGLKPNSELILGYGFSLSGNPDDTIMLKVAGLNGQRWSVGRGARGVEGLWKELLRCFVPDPETTPSYEDLLDAAGALAEMSEALVDKLPELPIQSASDMRSEVMAMLADYVEGQRDILESIIRFCKEKEKEGMQAAREEGIEIVLE